ncbi:shufflon system plasmid conjugative transfer pilus tip adhesin PilV (plasmid) [Burkholderia cenocepacia]|uniref:shufflon system plasmid conjugative transfer pilus tip adhesin PilV n=1 Tax=Burkholderia cenocepacia TaxID=95486 RepID=UPI0020A0F64E|nr:shufflon system plasmid conjugative transfer pilus tip adhesin PilV [Burkholderia cenocepacia]MCO8402827.1 shufflon system plasmid conjugative transfer pilus tip adhesin PilV [Burkholderia cenocepacia]MCO8415066.1 shufflon system plasmid conjugative transfer pilus tip adhesin PilV [Burkholderia cenocepacia]MCO8423038.1 shufflon system plasmid conjugative transfer pilus tip adhesin PilV [Burkholderia cenocepacia]MCO8474813.1 shufflon system plasmid conjugative transfer pilus tip adhesin PilV 
MAPILGTLIAFVLSLLGFGTIATISIDNLHSIQASATASQLLILNKAAQQYVTDNAAALVSTATATTPVTVTVAQLITGNYLPASYLPRNPYRQTWQLQVLQPNAGVLQSLVTSTGGTQIPVKQLPVIAAQAGAQGGFVPYQNQGGNPNMVPTSAFGAYGAWQVSLANFANPGAGHMASLLAFGNTQVNNSYLYRIQVPNHPELNAMQTDLGMTDVGGTAHDINGANVISTQSLRALSNGSLGTPSISTANGKVITWNQVPEGGVLSLQGADGTWVHVENLNGTFRLINSAWNAQLFSVDQNGNVTAMRTIQAGNIATPNTACPTNGQAAANSDGSGQWLQCIYKQWKPFGGNILRMGYYLAQHGTGVPAPTCPRGGTPLATVTPFNFSVDSTAIVNYGAWGSGPWTVYVQDGSGAPIPGAQATVGTYCAY